ncbi:hypothetical protein [Rubritalea squalenifaciens]|nr:hypothetical protein [Rubritalea squalenifaciens]
MRLLLIVLLSLTPLLGGEKVLPEGGKFKVKVVPQWKIYGLFDKMQIAAVYRFERGKEECEESLQAYCSELRDEKSWYPLDEDGLTMVFAEAAAGKPCSMVKEVKDREGVELTYVSYQGVGGYEVKLSSGEQSVTFSPQDIRDFMEIRAVFDSSKAWYGKLMVAEEVPEWTEKARPPKVYWVRVDSELGAVQAGELTLHFGAQMRRALPYTFHVRQYSVDYGGEKKDEGLNGRYLYRVLTSVADDVKRGRDRSIPLNRGRAPSQVTYQVNGSVADERVHVVCRVDNKEVAKGSFTLEQIEKIRSLDQQVQERHDWMVENRKLLYEGQRSAISDDVGLDILLKIRCEQAPEMEPMELRVVRNRGWMDREMSPLWVEMRWEGFGPDIGAVRRDVLAEYCKACEAAAKKENYRVVLKGEVETLIETQEVYGRWMVKVKRGGKVAMIAPGHLDVIKWALHQADNAQAWYQKVMDTRLAPEPTKEAHPPVVEDAEVVVNAALQMEGAGRGKMGFLHRMSYTPEGGVKKQLALRWSEYVKGGVGEVEHFVDQDLTEDLDSHFKEAIKARNAGENYLYECGQKGGERFRMEVTEDSRDIVLLYFLKGEEEGQRMYLEESWMIHHKQNAQRLEEEAEWLEKHPEVFFTLKK